MPGCRIRTASSVQRLPVTMLQGFTRSRHPLLGRRSVNRRCRHAIIRWPQDGRCGELPSHLYEDARRRLHKPRQKPHGHTPQLLPSSGDHETQLHHGIFTPGWEGWGEVKMRKQNHFVNSLNVCPLASRRASPVPTLGRVPITNHHPQRRNVCLIPGTYCGGKRLPNIV